MTKFKTIQTLFLTLLITYGSITNMRSQNNESLIIGTWKIQKAYFNGQISILPKGTNLKFTVNKRVKITLPKFGKNNEDISGLGFWKKNDSIIIIEYDKKKFWGESQKWRIKNLTETTLEWEREMKGGLQREIYTKEK